MNKLTWKEHGFDNYPMLVIKSPGDGKCLLHSICNSFYKKYRDSNDTEKRNIVVKLSNELATYLETKSVTNPNITNYEEMDILSEFGQALPDEFSLQGIQKLLRSDNFLGPDINLILSKIFKKDIYYLRYETKDLYILDDIPKGENPSVVVLYSNQNHFDLIGLQEGNAGMSICFEATHPFIVFLRNRLIELKKENNASDILKK